jgi:hypothetical protein
MQVIHPTLKHFFFEDMDIFNLNFSRLAETSFIQKKCFDRTKFWNIRQEWSKREVYLVFRFDWSWFLLFNTLGIRLCR